MRLFCGRQRDITLLLTVAAEDVVGTYVQNVLCKLIPESRSHTRQFLIAYGGIDVCFSKTMHRKNSRKMSFKDNDVVQFAECRPYANIYPFEHLILNESNLAPWKWIQRERSCWWRCGSSIFSVVIFIIRVLEVYIRLICIGWCIGYLS